MVRRNNYRKRKGASFDVCYSRRVKECIPAGSHGYGGRGICGTIGGKDGI